MWSWTKAVTILVKYPAISSLLPHPYYLQTPNYNIQMLSQYIIYKTLKSIPSMQVQYHFIPIFYKINLIFKNYFKEIILLHHSF